MSGIRFGKVWILLPLGVIAFSGCYGAKLLRQPLAVDETNEEVKTISERQALLEQRIATLEESLARQEEMVRALRADTQSTLTELNQSMETVGTRLDDALTRKSSPPARSWVPPAAPGASGDSAGTAGVVNPAEAKMIYDNAYLDLTRGNYALALLGFQDFLMKDPQSELADNAQYWIGESYYAQRDFRHAIDEFRKVEQSYPRGDKIPAALLKIAFSHLQLEDRSAARDVLQDLVRRYPKSDEARQAKAKLQSIG